MTSHRRVTWLAGGCRHVALAGLVLAVVVSPTVPVLHAQSEEVPGLPGVKRVPDTFSSSWRRVTSEHFTAVGNTDVSRIRQAVQALEVFRLVVAADDLPNARLPAAAPVLVMFRDDSGFAPFRPQSPDGQRLHVGAYYHETVDRAYMVLPSPSGLGPVLHEYAHAVITFNFGELPTWLSEGLAELYASVADSGSGDPGSLGRPIGARLVDAGHSYPSVAELIATESFWDSNARRTALQYAKALALVHYLFVGRAETRRPGEIARYRAAIAAGRTPGAAFAEAFGISVDDAQRGLDAYLRRLEIPVTRIAGRTSVPTVAMEGVRMLQSEVDSIQGNVLLAVGNLDEGERRLVRSLSRNPESADARIGLAKHRLMNDRPTEAVDLLAPVVERDPSRAFAWYYLGRGLRLTGRYQEAYDAFQRVVQLGAPGASTALAWVESSVSAFGDERPDEGRAAMDALQAMGDSPAWYFTRARAFWELGRDADVVNDIETFLINERIGGRARPYAAFLGALSARRLGWGDREQTLLEAAEVAPDRAPWTSAVLAYLCGTLTGDQLVSKATGIAQITEAHAYVGIGASLAGQTDTARRHLQWVRERGSRSAPEYRYAVAELARLDP